MSLRVNEAAKPLTAPLLPASDLESPGPDGAALLRRTARRVALCLLLAALVQGAMALLGVALATIAAEGKPGAAPLLDRRDLPMVVLPVVFAFLSWAALARPRLAALTACLAFAIWLILWGLFDPHAIVQGLIVELVIAALLAQSVLAALRHGKALQTAPRQNPTH